MRPHIVPRVILREFRVDSEAASPVLVMDKSTKVFRERGVNHSVFLGPSDYLGNGEKGSLENEMALKDEQAIKDIVGMVRAGVDLTEHFQELKFLLGNNAARNPYFRTHPSVRDDKALSSEVFHGVAMDIFPGQYLNIPIRVFRTKNGQ